MRSSGQAIIDEVLRREEAMQKGEDGTKDTGPNPHHETNAILVLCALVIGIMLIPVCLWCRRCLKWYRNKLALAEDPGVRYYCTKDGQGRLEGVGPQASHKSSSKDLPYSHDSSRFPAVSIANLPWKALLSYEDGEKIETSPTQGIDYYSTEAGQKHLEELRQQASHKSPSADLPHSHIPHRFRTSSSSTTEIVSPPSQSTFTVEVDVHREEDAVTSETSPSTREPTDGASSYGGQRFEQSPPRAALAEIHTLDESSGMCHVVSNEPPSRKLLSAPSSPQGQFEQSQIRFVRTEVRAEYEASAMLVAFLDVSPPHEQSAGLSSPRERSATLSAEEQLEHSPPASDLIELNATYDTTGTWRIQLRVPLTPGEMRPDASAALGQPATVESREHQTGQGSSSPELCGMSSLRKWFEQSQLQFTVARVDVLNEILESRNVRRLLTLSQPSNLASTCPSEKLTSQTQQQSEQSQPRPVPSQKLIDNSPSETLVSPTQQRSGQSPPQQSVPSRELLDNLPSETLVSQTQQPSEQSQPRPVPSQKLIDNSPSETLVSPTQQRSGQSPPQQSVPSQEQLDNLLPSETLVSSTQQQSRQSSPRSTVQKPYKIDETFRECHRPRVSFIPRPRFAVLARQRLAVPSSRQEQLSPRGLVRPSPRKQSIMLRPRAQLDLSRPTKPMSELSLSLGAQSTSMALPGVQTDQYPSSEELDFTLLPLSPQEQSVQPEQQLVASTPEKVPYKSLPRYAYSAEVTSETLCASSVQESGGVPLPLEQSCPSPPPEQCSPSTAREESQKSPPVEKRSVGVDESFEESLFRFLLNKEDKEEADDDDTQIAEPLVEGVFKGQKILNESLAAVEEPAHSRQSSSSSSSDTLCGEDIDKTDDGSPPDSVCSPSQQTPSV